MVAVLAAVAGWSTSVFAQAGGPELRTDDPYFPGEGAMSTPPRVLQLANTTSRGTLGAATDRDKLIRLFLWRGEHFAHQVSPAVYNLPGVTPSPSADNSLMTDYDAMRGLFSYGWGLCGTNHAQMRVFADEAGWASRRRGLVGDTGYEILVDANVPAGETGWRYVNTDQYTLHFLTNSASAHFASLDEVVTTNHHYIEWNPDIGLGYFLPQANTHGGYQDFAGVTGTVPDRSLQWRSYYNGVWTVPAGGNTKLYGEGYTTTPVVVLLKRGETFTRWIDPTGVVNDLGLAGKIWWGYDAGNQGGGDSAPFVQWSFVQNAPARDQVGPVGANPEASSLVGQRNGNACFLWTPNLSLSEHLDGTAAITGTLTTGGSPTLRSTGNSTLVLFHNAPYTIAGRPSDATNPANASSDGAVLSADTVGIIPVEISINAGATWSSIGSLSGAGARLDFTDSVKGHNQYLLRLSFADSQGLNALSLRTITMLNQAVYPNLKSGTTQVTYQAANVGGLELSPDLWSSTSANSSSGYVQKVGDSGNLSGVYYVGDTVGYSATDSNALSVTYKITMPPGLASQGATWKQIFAAADATVRVTPMGNPYTKIEISPDQSSWTQIGRYDPPSDDEFSAYWAYGRSADGSTLGGTTYYVRYTTYNGGYTSKLRYLRLSATYTLPASSAPLNVNYYWSNGSNQTSAHAVAAGATSDSWSISTGAGVVQQKVAMSVGSVTTTTPPTITTQPADQVVTAGQTATFSVVASGTAPLTYQWQKNGTNIPGATGSSYTTPATTVGDSGSTFQVIVSNSAGSVTSRAATLTVNAGGGSTTVTLQQGANGYSGTVDTYIDQFQANSSFGNLDRLEVRYYDPGNGLTEHMITMIQFDLSSIPAGATVTSAQLTLFNTRAAANGASDVLVLDKITSSWSDTNTWAMGIPSTAPSGVTCPSVAGYSLSPATPEAYVITGMDALVQGWISTPASNYGLMLSTTTNLNIRFASSEYAQSQYRPALQVIYTGGGGGTAPTITTQPSSTSTPDGQTATFTVVASGTAPLSYQWQKNGVNIPGATGASYTTPTVTMADDGSTYRVIVSNSSGSVTSASATLTVIPATSGGGSSGSSSHKKCGCGSVADPSPACWALLGAILLMAFLGKRSH